MAWVNYPWRDNRSLEQVLAESRAWLTNERIIAVGLGFNDVEIAAAERRLRRPFPEEVRELYRTYRPVRVFSKDGPEEFGFYQLDQLELRWESLGHDDAVPVEDWARAEGLVIGQSLYGDPIFWVRGHRTRPDGCVMVFDHELAMGDLFFAVVARSLAEFVGKVVCLRGLNGRPDSLEDLTDHPILNAKDEDLMSIVNADSRLDLFKAEYAELNPTSKAGA